MSLATETSKPLQSRRRLRYLLASTGVSVTGDGVLIAAAPLLAASLTRDPVLIGAVAAAGYAAWLVVGLPAGALVDRWPRRPVLVIADVARALVLLGLTALLFTGNANVWTLIVAVFLLGVGSCFFDPVAQAMIPAVVGRDQQALSHANGKFWALDTFGRSLAGPPLGAAAFGLSRALPFIGDAISFLVSAALVSRLPRVEPDRIDHPPILTSIREGLTFLFKTVELRALTLGMAGYNLGWNIAFATFVLFVQDVLHLGDLGYGLLLGASALGGIASGWLTPRVTQGISVRLVYAIALLLQAASWLLVLLSEHPWFAAVGLVCIGVASTAVSVTGGAARQILTPDDKLGRVVAATRLLGIGSAAIGALLGGLLADVGSLRTPFIAAAALLVAASAAFFVRRHPA